MSILEVRPNKVNRLPTSTLAGPKPIKAANGKPLKGGLSSSTNRIPVIKPKLLWALDIETTGLDFWHGCQPYSVAVLCENGDRKFWQWEEYIDPFTRHITPPQADLDELAELILTQDFVLHNTKVDVRGLEAIGLPRINLETVHDTLIGSHVLCSNESHGLKDLALQYLDITDEDEKELIEATNKARAIARHHGWAIANEKGHPYYPATTTQPDGGWQVMDRWLLRALAIHLNYPKDHPWHTLNRRYNERDVERTIGMFYAQQDAFQTYGNEGLYECYEERRRNLEATYEMENDGATVSIARLNTMRRTFIGEAHSHRDTCLKILGKLPPKIDAKGRAKPVEPNLNSSAQIQWLLFHKLGLKATKLTKKSTLENPNYATDKTTLLNLLKGFDQKAAHHARTGRKGNPLTSKELSAKTFIENLLLYRRNEKSDGYLEEYANRSVPWTPNPACTAARPSKAIKDLRKDSPTPATRHGYAPLFPGWEGGCEASGVPYLPHRKKGRQAATLLEPPKVPMMVVPPDQMLPRGWGLLHFWFNITGTKTTRFSSSQPNGQNIGKAERYDDEGNLIEDFNLRKAFGPMPGREWYSVDYSNIELRLFAWESGDQNLINAFNTGYSVHLIFAEVVYPREFMLCRNEVLKKLGQTPDKSNLYLDSTTRAAGDLFKSRYESSFYQWCKNGNFALIYGAGIEKADNTYHVSGAYDLIRSKLPLIDELMRNKNQEALTYGYVTLRPGCNYRLYVPWERPHVAVNYFVQGRAGWCMARAINRVHTYLKKLNAQLNLAGFDRYRMIMTIHDELVFDFPKHERNREVIAKIKWLMERSGDDVECPTPVEVELHTDNWGVGKKLKDLQALAC
jgi:DNA polymerase I-like protein with 3'-5' exonuclease and polymerase domains